MAKESNKKQSNIKESSSQGSIKTGAPVSISIGNEYANSASIHMPLTKAAQYMGGSPSTIFTQPMFFSPLHTPQSWQIASKRKEVYQWARFYYENEPKAAAGIDFYCFDPTTPILMANGSQRSISSIDEGDAVRSHDGTVGIVDKVHKKYTEENLYYINISGVNNGSLKATGGHSVLVSRDEDIRWMDVCDLQKGDYLLTPCNYEAAYGQSEKFSISEDMAWLLGIYAAEGCGIPYDHVSKRGKKTSRYRGVYFTLHRDEVDLAIKIKNLVDKMYPNLSITFNQLEDKKVLRVAVYGKEISDDLMGLCPGTSSDDGSKRIISSVMKSKNSILFHLLSGFLEGDGCFNKNNGFQGVGVTKTLCEQMCNLCDRLGIEHSFTSTRISRENRQTCYNIRISRRACSVFEDVNNKHYTATVDESKIRNTPYFANGKYIYRKITSIKQKQYQGDVYDLTVKGSHTYIANRVSVHNSGFPMNGFKVECKDRKVQIYFEDVVKSLNLDYWFKKISHEYFLLGDVFVFTEIECPICGGGGINPSDGSQCNHPDGSIKKILILNPDFIEVQSNQLADDPVVSLIPDDDLKRIIASRKPVEIYERIPDNIKELVAAGRPIPLSSRCVSHLKHKGSPYGTYGESLLRRLFMVIAYKTKLMTANWIMAERHVLPIRIAKVGETARPASGDDIADVQEQLAAVANDPNLTIVTHHAFDLDFVGATGRIHNIAPDLEYVGKEMLDGLMLNQSLLNGEMQSYSGAAVGVETMIRRLESWRQELSHWAEINIFLPIAQMQGFIDAEKTEILGKPQYLYPKIKWNDLRLRDNSNHLQQIQQLHDKGVVSTQKLCEEYDLDYDLEIKRIREEQVMSGKGGMISGAAGAVGGLDGDMGMGMGMDMGMSGGAPSLPGGDMGGGMDVDMPAMPGGDMGGGMDMGGSMGGGMDGMAASSFDDKIYKKGKAPKKEEVKVSADVKAPIFLTKPEQKLYNIIVSMRLPYKVYAQFKQFSPGNSQPYLLDFAIPEIGINFEADGARWHSDIESVTRDRKRDLKLASLGWRVVRVKEDALNNKADLVQQVVKNNIEEAIHERQELLKKSDNNNESLLKFSSSEKDFNDYFIVKPVIIDNDKNIS
jgi:intein/homing endonuclease/very-short-patch-repair endonuclease